MEQQQGGAGDAVATAAAPQTVPQQQASVQGLAPSPPVVPHQASSAGGHEAGAPGVTAAAAASSTKATTIPTLSSAKQEEISAGEFETECNEALALIDQHIYAREGDYLEKTAHGNVARGWEGFLDTRAGSIQKRRFDDRDRLFSFSSWTFCAVNPHLFSNTRDEDPDNWCLALRKRSAIASSGNSGHSTSLERARKKRKT